MIFNIIFTILFLSQCFSFGTWSLAFLEVKDEKSFSFYYCLAVISAILGMSVFFIENNIFLIMFSIYTLGLTREIDEARHFLTYPKGKAKYLFATILWPIEYFVDQESPMRKFGEE